jgi:galactoside O-acetyltransferase
MEGTIHHSVVLKSCGLDTVIHPFCRIASPDRVTIGNACVLDDLTFLYGDIIIHDFVHVAAQASLVGEIEIGSYAGVSGGTRVYASSDYFDGRCMTNPCIPSCFRVADRRPVKIGKHALIGTGAVILPGVTVGEGAVVGALSLVKEDLEPWGIYAGTPARRVGTRKRETIEESALRLEMFAYRDGVYIPRRLWEGQLENMYGNG